VSRRQLFGFTGTAARRSSLLHGLASLSGPRSDRPIAPRTTNHVPLHDTRDETEWIFQASKAALKGLLAGLSVKVALVKLPTRRRIGAVAYAAFARGSDLGNGVWV
jgi:hypothetical protein